MTKPFAEQYPNMHKEGIETDVHGMLSCGNPWVLFSPTTAGFEGVRPATTASLDGQFTAATLREIADFMEAPRK